MFAAMISYVISRISVRYGHVRPLSYAFAFVYAIGFQTVSIVLFSSNNVILLI